MDTSAFEASLREDGFGDAERKDGQPGFSCAPHTHPFDVRVLVLRGEFGLVRDGATQTFGAGDVFAMEAGCEHAESFGPQGASYLVGRKPLG
jgi:quercetin dioxygenase-like cupin family protein